MIIMDDVFCKLCDKIEAPLILVTNENNERDLNFGIIPICVYCADIINSYNNYQKEMINFIAIDYREEYFVKLRENKMKYIHNFLKDIDKSDKLGKTKTFKSIRWLTLFIY